MISHPFARRFASTLVLLACVAVPSAFAAEPSDVVGVWEGTASYSDPGSSEPYMSTPLLMEVWADGAGFDGIAGFAGFVVDLTQPIPRENGAIGFAFSVRSDSEAREDVIDGRLLPDGSLELRREDEFATALWRLRRVPAPEADVELPSGLFTGVIGFSGKASDEMQVSLSIQKAEGGPRATLGARKTTDTSDREIAVSDISVKVRGKRVVFTLRSEGIESRLYADITGSSFRICGQIPTFGGGAGVLSRSVQQ